MPGRLTNLRNTIAAAFVAADRGTVPTIAQFNALNTGTTSMGVRRVFGSFVRGMKNSLVYAGRAVNAAPTVTTIANATTDLIGTLSKDVTSNFTDPEAATLTYSATLSDGSALPSWLAFSAGVFTGSGTATLIADDVYTIRVTAADIYGRTVSTTFTITVTE